KVGPVVAVDVARGHGHAAAEQEVVGEEAEQHLAGRAAEHLDVRAAAGARAGDDVGNAVAVHVTRGDINAAAEGRVVRHELLEHRPGDAVEHADVRAAAGSRTGEEVGRAVAVEVGGRHADAAAERQVVGGNVQRLAGRPVPQR